MVNSEQIVCNRKSKQGFIEFVFLIYLVLKINYNFYYVDSKI